MNFLKLADAKIIDPKSGDEIICDVAIQDSKIKEIGTIPDSKADKIVKINKRILAPALIDLHSHVYPFGTSLGVDPDELGQKSGVDIFVDAGSAGAGNFLGFRKHVIEHSRVKIYCFLNIAFGGIPFFGIGNNNQVGEVPNLMVADEEKCFNCINKNRDLVVGVKVRLSEKANGEFGVDLLFKAKKVARKSGLPMMIHFGRPPPDISQILPHLERGDILTHSFRAEPNSILSRDGEVLDFVKEAKKKGIWIDIGHGNGSFSFKTAKAAIENGFLPDTISTDVHQFSVPYPVYDLPTTMGKLLNLGMPLDKVIRAVTSNPANAINKSSDHGVIEVGRQGDLVVLEVEDHSLDVHDATNQLMTLKRIIRPSLRITKGEVSSIDYHFFDLGRTKQRGS